MSLEVSSLLEDLVPRSDETVEDEMLPSFGDIKRRTMRDLYGTDGNDKSPKGSVDTAIRMIVDLLNALPSFATLSSCSGRIALFDPYMQRSTVHPDHNADNSDELLPDNDRMPSTDSGKGRGGWLLASHEEVDPSVLPQLLDTHTSSDHVLEPLMLKHEPLLLHVAACSLEKGRQLLSLALKLGFRESGIVLSPHRVTVAVRGQSLALTVPLARQGPLRPSNEYLVELIRQSNQRMRSNQEKLQKLQHEVEQTFFQKRNLTAITPKYEVTFSALPPLNLWGHAAVAIPMEGVDDVDVLVFGGYGEGPELVSETMESKVTRKCARSGSIYRLTKRNGRFGTKWEEVTQIASSDAETIEPGHTWYGIDVTTVTLSPREGCDACILPLSEAISDGPTVVALWGGRSGPGNPFGDLLLCQPSAQDVSCFKPLNVRGEHPPPRWGHSFTALSGRDGLLAVVVGGRNEQVSFGTTHTLSIVTTVEGESHFRWDTLELGIPAHFHHTAVAVEDSILIFGGLSNPSDLLETFHASVKPKGEPSIKRPCPLWAFDVSGDAREIKERSVRLLPSTMAEFGTYYGAAGCILDIHDVTGQLQSLIALSGGLRNTPVLGETEPIRWLTCNSTGEEFELAQVDVHVSECPEEIDFAGMVHHRCIQVPSAAGSAELILIGGGVLSFAFGAAFARSYQVRLVHSSDGSDRRMLEQASLSVIPSKTALFERDQRAVEAVTNWTDVVYVSNRDAKTLKTALEQDTLLDKQYRMTKADAAAPLSDPASYVAVPITKEGMAVFQDDSSGRPSWISLVAATGKQEVPFSTAVMGRKKLHKKP